VSQPPGDDSREEQEDEGNDAPFHGMVLGERGGNGN
jgi:hypothetical protein